MHLKVMLHEPIFNVNIVALKILLGAQDDF